MGSIPNCCCVEKRKDVIKNSELIIKKYESCNLIRLERTNNSDTNKKLDNEIINKSTLSPQVPFINPLPNIVILKHKKI